MGSSGDDLNVILFQLAVNYVKGSTDIEETKRIIAVENAVLFGRILPVVEAFVRTPIENTSITALSDNLNNLRLSGASIEKCVEMLKNLKHEVQTDASFHHKYFPTLTKMRWRVDITISSSVISRVLEPNIIVELELSNACKVTFELSVSKFHKLRYTVASILKEMDHMDHKMSAIKV